MSVLDPQSLAPAYTAVRAGIQTALADAGRPANAVQLLAVSKTFPADAVRALHALGQCAFAENYVQEALDKISALADLPLEWHFIGPIQSNKTTPIARHFDWVHSVDRAKIADRLNEARAGLPPLNVLIQVNVSAEASKSGVAPDDALALARHIAALPHLRLRGLMAIPAPTEDAAAQHAAFARLRTLLETLRPALGELDTLSMGMSGDYPAAIREGATHVRIGSAIFGTRPARPPL